VLDELTLSVSYRTKQARQARQSCSTATLTFGVPASAFGILEVLLLGGVV
jgi:hypothetical protein